MSLMAQPSALRVSDEGAVIAQPHDAMMSLRALHQGFSDGLLLGPPSVPACWE